MNQNFIYILSDRQKIYFLVCCRILVISLCVPWDRKDWKSLIYLVLNMFKAKYEQFTYIVTLISHNANKQILSFKIFYLFIFRESRREGEREREKHQCVVASHAPPTGDLAHNPGMCPDWELNQRPFASQSALNPLNHTSQCSYNWF